MLFFSFTKVIKGFFKFSGQEKSIKKIGVVGVFTLLFLIVPCIAYCIIVWVTTKG